MIKQGDIIEVSMYDDFDDAEQKEFITMTDGNKFLCWNADNTCAYIWNYGREIDQSKTIYGCAKLGAIIELYDKNLEAWIETRPTWVKGVGFP
jgi:hypothetical protein